MKKLVALVLALCLALTCATALAAGKLTVAQETYTPAELYTDAYAGFIFAEVTNSGDKNVSFAGGIFEILNADGEALESSDMYSCYPSVLAPGETGYVFRYDTVDAAKSVEDIPDYTLTVSGKSSTDEAPVRLTASATVEEVERWSSMVYQVKVTVTNETDATAYDTTVTYGLYDAEGKLLYCDSTDLYRLGIPAGQTVEVVLEVSDSLKAVWDKAGVKPATVQAIAFMED